MTLSLHVYTFPYGVTNMATTVCFKYFKVKRKNIFSIFDLEISNIFKMNADIFSPNILHNLFSKLIISLIQVLNFKKKSLRLEIERLFEFLRKLKTKQNKKPDGRILYA